MNPNRKSDNEMIYAVSDDPNEKRRKPRLVPRKLIGRAAWKNHQYREVPDPNIEPEPKKIAPVRVGPDERDLLIAELQAKLAATEAPKEHVAEQATEQPTEGKPGPGRPPKEKTQA